MTLPGRVISTFSDASQMQFEAAERIKADKALKASQTAQNAPEGVKTEKVGESVPS